MVRSVALFILLSFVSVLHLSPAEAQAGTAEGQKMRTQECAEAFDRLAAQNELIRQVGAAYLSTIETLEQVYLSFGERLSKINDPKEMAEIGAFFLQSGRALQKAQDRSRESINELNAEMQRLTEKATHCYEGSSVLAGQQPIGADETLSISDVYVPKNMMSSNEATLTLTGMSHYCTRVNAPKLRSTSEFVHEVTLTGSIYNCNYPIMFSKRFFQTQLNLGRLRPGRHTLRFSPDSEFRESEIAFEIKP